MEPKRKWEDCREPDRRQSVRSCGKEVGEIADELERCTSSFRLSDHPSEGTEFNKQKSESLGTHAWMAAAQMKLSPRYVCSLSPPPTIRGWKATCSSPTVLGFCKITESHCAGHRKSKLELLKGEHRWPSKSHWSLGTQNVDRQLR